MKIIETIIQNILLFYFLVVYIGTIVGLLCAERIMLIDKKTNQTVILLLIIAFISFCLFFIVPAESYETRYEIMKIDVSSQERTYGVQIIAVEQSDNNKKIISLGEFVTNEGNDSRYMTVSIADGNIMCDEQSQYGNLIAESLIDRGISIGNFEGKSCIYQNLAAKVDTMNNNRKPCKEILIAKACIVFIPEAFLLLQYMIFVFCNKRKMMRRKIKINDL